MKEQIDVWCQGFTQHCWHTQLCILAARMYLEIKVLKRKGRLFLIKLSFMWLFCMFRALSRHHLNNLVILPGNGNVNRVISFPNTEVNCPRPAVAEAPLSTAFLLKSWVQSPLFRFGMHEKERDTWGEGRGQQLRDESSLWVCVQD